jgi:hypothetical protein
MVQVIAEPGHIARAGVTVNPGGSELAPRQLGHHSSGPASGGDDNSPPNVTDLSEVQGVIPHGGGGRSGQFQEAAGKAKQAWGQRKTATTSEAEGMGADAGEAAAGVEDAIGLALL